MSFQKGNTHTVIHNEAFKKTAEELAPEIFSKRVYPINLIETVQDEQSIHGWKVEVIESVNNLKEKDFRKGTSFILDFGQHMVGYLSLTLSPVGSPPDAPLSMRLTFGEMPVEVSEPFSSYDGWISSSWLQEETIYVDVLPNEMNLPRRYSFRYVKVDVLDTSQKYTVKFNEISCKTVTSADVSKVSPLNHNDADLQKIDEISIKTLEDCMQEVFEDGPKRDRRLWLGDLRLQALANYSTFKNNDLVKRNLYQFAAVPNSYGQVAANLFIAPTLIPDDTFLYDYSLFFATTLYDYYMETKDVETLQELWPVAYRQIEIGIERLDENDVVRDDPSWWSFIDWHPELNKQAPSQAILIYSLKRAITLAEVLEKNDEKNYFKQKLENVIDGSLKQLWDDEIGFFISGENRQVSWASQVWMVLAEVFEKEKNMELMKHLLKQKPSIGMVTPYMYHHLAEALLLSGERDEAVALIKQYWGGMIRDGADTFWELYNPEDKEFSPYGNHLINSYCHAWSCTPTYLIREFEI
ncbi:alpha-L-rhamnosidase-related protein [Bacillus solitudinis]|uniref:alpha-L-rhamnosidase-related protein n=1 Tax=Bacillus solitudinis TaxID=2014074 RepID=UPI000C24F3F5|nr:family 78 glycoside hydrolase catalytic domain [Bacillus solitudinis]